MSGLVALGAGIAALTGICLLYTSVATVKDLWKLLDVSYDRFIRTTDDYHMESCQKIFTKLYEQGDIYKGDVYKRQEPGRHLYAGLRSHDAAPPRLL